MLRALDQVITQNEIIFIYQMCIATREVARFALVHIVFYWPFDEMR